MAKYNWNEITVGDVIEAIRVFDSENPEYPQPRSTFLVFEGKKYPAKHIRGMAYKIHFGKEISKDDYSGGQDTIRFFSKLGFDIFHITKKDTASQIPVEDINKVVKTDCNEKEIENSYKNSIYQPHEGIKIGLYLQTDELYGKRKVFDETMNIVSASDIDILVFPEFSYVPFEKIFKRMDFLNNNDVQKLYKKTLDLSEKIGKAIVVCNEDKFGTIMSIYANAFAEEGETVCKSYIKHTMTNYSACEIQNYSEYAKLAFQPIFYKGYRIGLTICYDCNHAVFSRKYGQTGVDIILNSTGGNVVYDKWYKYNKVRAIENHCFTFVTMGGPGDIDNPHNYVYGFTPTGKEMHPLLLNEEDTDRHNSSGGIYVYNTSDYDGTVEVDSSVDQSETINKKQNLYFPVSDIESLISQARKLSESLFVLEHKGMNVILCLIQGDDIRKPERVLKLLYAKELKKWDNKRYIIVNEWDIVDDDYYKTQLSVVLKVRAMENYCAIILKSKNMNKCYQCGQNRTAQVVKSENGLFGIDLSRTGGPETIWRNKDGMKAAWRENIEWLIESLVDE